MTCQRWREHRSSYRPAGEVIDPRRFEVAAIDDDTTAKAFVESHHYSRSYPAARFRFGIYTSELVGVAVFSHPCNDKVLTSVFPGAPLESVELGRFVLLDEVPGNGETWFLARCFELLRQKVRGVVSFSDPIPRTTVRGITIFPGHIGTIYQAHNAIYRGRGTARGLLVLPDGRVLSARALQKMRAGEKGWVAAAQVLESFGADRAPIDAGDRAQWLVRWLPQLTRRLRHPGNYKYAWAFQRSERRSLHSVAPYPKRVAA